MGGGGGGGGGGGWKGTVPQRLAYGGGGLRLAYGGGHSAPVPQCPRLWGGRGEGGGTICPRG